jgi:protein-S-isoprenylcysteine O-methyltransferase Ste14
MPIVDVIIPAIWIAVWIYWLAASAKTKPTRTRSRSSIGFRVAVLLTVLAMIRVGVFRGHSPAMDNPWLQGIGLAVFLMGLAFAVWARVYLGRNWGTPMSQKVEPELITSGPYRYVRHPIYSGIILGMAGTAMAISIYWVVGVVMLGAYFIYSASIEERNMARFFPEAYPAYKRSTKMLIPFVF